MGILLLFALIASYFKNSKHCRKKRGNEQPQEWGAILQKTEPFPEMKTALHRNTAYATARFYDSASI